MPSILGSAELKFKTRRSDFPVLEIPTLRELSLAVRESLIYRKIYLAVVPTSGVWNSYQWTGSVQFRLKGNAVTTWRVGYRSKAGVDLTGDWRNPTLTTEVNEAFITPPYWVETFTAATADWPVTAPSPDEHVILLEDPETTSTKYHVHLLPIRCTGHFDEIVFAAKQASDFVSGYAYGQMVLGCMSQPEPD
jgi:hypothetical protein